MMPSRLDPSFPPVNEGARPSRLDLARHATGEIVLDGPLDAGWLATLDAERARVEPFDYEILAKRAARLPAEPTDARPPDARVSTPLPFGLRLPFPPRLIALALGALAFVFVLLPDVHPDHHGASGPLAGAAGGAATGDATGSGASAAATPEEGLKGIAEADAGSLGWYVQRGDAQVRGARGLTLEDGDAVGFRLYSARYPAVTLVQVDAAGAVAPLDAARGFAPLPLEPMRRVPLDVHFVVHPPVDTRVVAFFGEWTEARVRATVTEAWRTGGAAALRDLADRADDIDLVTLRTE